MVDTWPSESIYSIKHSIALYSVISLPYISIGRIKVVVFESNIFISIIIKARTTKKNTEKLTKLRGKRYERQSNAIYWSEKYIKYIYFRKRFWSKSAIFFYNPYNIYFIFNIYLSLLRCWFFKYGRKKMLFLECSLQF